MCVYILHTHTHTHTLLLLTADGTAQYKLQHSAELGPVRVLPDEVDVGQVEVINLLAEHLGGREGSLCFNEPHPFNSALHWGLIRLMMFCIQPGALFRRVGMVTWWTKWSQRNDTTNMYVGPKTMHTRHFNWYSIVLRLLERTVSTAPP